MKKIKIFQCFATASVALFCLSGISANNNIIEIFGEKFIFYEAKNKETLFAIARDNNWNDTVLERLNPSLEGTLKKGEKIFYPLYSDSSFGNTNNFSNNYESLTHKVKSDESIYSIAELYNIPVERLYQMNPESRNGINEGDIIIIRPQSNVTVSVVPETEINNMIENRIQDINNDTEISLNGNETFYTVKSGERLSDIALNKNVSVSSLLLYNPGITSNVIPVGEIIKIPAAGTGLEMKSKTVEKRKLDNFTLFTASNNDSWSSISEKFNVDTILLKSINPDVEVIKKNTIVAIPNFYIYTLQEKVPVRDTRENSDNGIRQIYEDLHSVSNNDSILSIRMAILTESPSSKKDIEFIRGFLTGIKEKKNNSYKLSLKVIDGAKTDQEIIDQFNTYNPNIIFTTSDKGLPEYLGKFAFDRRTPVVNVFDIKNEEYRDNPYIIQLMPPAVYFNENVARNVYKKYGNYKLVIIGEEDENDLLAQAMKKLWSPADIKYLPTASFEAMNDSTDNRILFYGYPTKKEEVKNILSEIASLMQKNADNRYAVIGRPNWILFETSLKNELCNVNASVPSRFYINTNSDKYKQFCSVYSNLYNSQPVKSVPLHAASGYDTAIYFIQALADANLDPNFIKPSQNTLQTSFDLKRINNWSGFINLPDYMINFTPEGTIEAEVIE